MCGRDNDFISIGSVSPEFSDIEEDEDEGMNVSLSGWSISLVYCILHRQHKPVL